MPYAILTPDNLTVFKIVEDDLPGGSTDYAAFGVIPVNLDVPAGFRRTGWQIVNNVAEPVLEEIPPPPPAPVPPSAGPYQIREALLDKGFFTPENPATAYDELDAWIDGMIDVAIPVAVAPAQNAKAKRAWRMASEIRRADPFVEMVRTAAGKTVAETDELFRHAATI